MAWQRKIPFGYEIRDGQIRPHPQEGEAVRHIFGQYLAGASLLTIAEGMTGRGPRYHQHTPEWNKHMVKRVLENARYTGTDGYPPLVSGADFAAAREQRGARNTYAPLPAGIRPIQDKAVCGLCGARQIRGHRTHGRVHWKCQNADCGQSVSLSDETLAAMVERRLRALARMPHLLTAPEPQRAASGLDAIRRQNELTQALNRGGESSRYMKSLILAAAAQRYSQIPDPTPAHRLGQLRARLEEGSADGETLSALLEAAVRAVRLSPGGTVKLELASGRSITEEKEESP